MPNQRDDPDLAEIQPVTRLENGIDRGDERLQDIVDQVRHAYSPKNASRGGGDLLPAGSGCDAGDACHSSYASLNFPGKYPVNVLGRGDIRFFRNRSLRAECLAARAEISPSLRLFGDALQPRHARFDIFDLDGLGGVLEDCLRYADLGGRWRVRIDQDLPQRGGRCRGSLLEPCDGWPESSPARLPVSGLELRQRKPAEEGPGTGPGSASGLLHVALRK